jgi:cell division protein FtsL
LLLISLMAILYLSQLGQAVTTNQQLQDLRTQQTELQRQNQDLVNTIGQEQSPAYIIAQAKKRGMVPGNPQNVQVVPNP